MLDDIAAQDEAVSDPGSEASAQPEYAKNEYRAREDEYLVVIGICTHLGCSPTFVVKDRDNSPSIDWKGGFSVLAMVLVLIWLVASLKVFPHQLIWSFPPINLFHRVV